MVATLVRLKWRITLNALKRSIWAQLAAVISAAGAAGSVILVILGAVALGRFAPVGPTATLIGALGALTVLGWCLVPLLFTGVDSTLDPRALAPWVASSRKLSWGLVVAGATGVPGIASGACLLLPALVWAVSGRWSAAGLAVLMAPAGLATCVLLSRVVVIGSGASTSRRGRDRITLVGALVGMGLLVLTNMVNFLVILPGGVGGETLTTIGRGLSLSPFGWALAAPGYLAQGRPAVSLAMSLGAVVLPAMLAPAWERIVRNVMTGEGATGHRSGRHAVPGAPADGAAPAGASAVAPLPWHRRLSRVIPSPAAAVASRCLRYWRTDPRYTVQAFSSVILTAVVGSIMVMGGQGSGPGEPRSAGVLLDGPPVQVLGIPVFIAAMMGWALHNDLGYDSTAVWAHLSAGLRGRDDRMGRTVAAAIWQLPALVVVTTCFAAWTGRWNVVPAVMGAVLGLYGAGLAWSNTVGAVMPYEATAPGESPMKSRGSGTTLVISLVQMLGMVAVGLLGTPVLVGIGILGLTGSWQWGWVLLVAGVLWGIMLAAAGVTIGGRLLDRRWVQVLATVRSWPGHAEIR